MTRKVYVVGRHTPDLGDSDEFEIAGQENITWPETGQETLTRYRKLLTYLMREGFDAVLLQSVPAQLAWAIAAHARLEGQLDPNRQAVFPVGLIINKPGDRPAGVSERFFFEDGGNGAHAAESAVKFANPRASVETSWSDDFGPAIMTVTCDPPMRFEFSHIEWL